MATMGGDGVFVVGLDIKPGVYRTAGPAAGRRGGYYALLSSTRTSDIIDNNQVAGPATIMVGPDVKAVSVSNCQPWFWQGADLNAAASSTVLPTSVFDDQAAAFHEHGSAALLNHGADWRSCLSR